MSNIPVPGGEARVFVLVAICIYGLLTFRPSFEERFGDGDAGPVRSSETSLFDN